MHNSICEPKRLLAFLSLAAGMMTLPGMATAKPIADSYWLTEDGSLALAIGACEAGSAVSCGLIAGLPGAATDAELARYRSDLCWLPILWDLKWDAAKMRWAGGKILDPETGDISDLDVVATGPNLELRVFEDGKRSFQTLILRPVETFKEACK